MIENAAHEAPVQVVFSITTNDDDGFKMPKHPVPTKTVLGDYLKIAKAPRNQNKYKALGSEEEFAEVATQPWRTDEIYFGQREKSDEDTANDFDEEITEKHICTLINKLSQNYGVAFQAVCSSSVDLGVSA